MSPEKSRAKTRERPSGAQSPPNVEVSGPSVRRFPRRPALRSALVAGRQVVDVHRCSLGSNTVRPDGHPGVRRGGEVLVDRRPRRARWLVAADRLKITLLTEPVAEAMTASWALAAAMASVICFRCSPCSGRGLEDCRLEEQGGALGGFARPRSRAHWDCPGALDAERSCFA